MGRLGTGRNNQLSQNGLLYDSEGNVFDLTEWYKTNNLSLDLTFRNDQIIALLQLVVTQLSLITGEEINSTDIEQKDLDL